MTNAVDTALQPLDLTEVVLQNVDLKRIVESMAALVKTRDDRAGFTPEVVARIAAVC